MVRLLLVGKFVRSVKTIVNPSSQRIEYRRHKEKSEGFPTVVSSQK